MLLIKRVMLRFLSLDMVNQERKSSLKKILKTSYKSILQRNLGRVLSYDILGVKGNFCYSFVT